MKPSATRRRRRRVAEFVDAVCHHEPRAETPTQKPRKAEEPKRGFACPEGVAGDDLGTRQPPSPVARAGMLGPSKTARNIHAKHPATENRGHAHGSIVAIESRAPRRTGEELGGSTPATLDATRRCRLTHVTGRDFEAVGPMVANVDPDQLREVWTDERFTLVDLGVRFGCTGATVANYAKQLGLPNRRRGRRRQRPGLLIGEALTGGEWVPNHRGVMVWRPSDG